MIASLFARAGRDCRLIYTCISECSGDWLIVQATSCVRIRGAITVVEWRSGTPQLTCQCDVIEQRGTVNLRKLLC